MGVEAEANVHVVGMRFYNRSFPIAVMKLAIVVTKVGISYRQVIGLHSTVMFLQCRCWCWC